MDDAVKQLLDADSPAAFADWQARHPLNEDLFARLMWALNRLVLTQRDVADRTINYLLTRALQLHNKDWQARLLLARSYLLMFSGKPTLGLEMSNAAIALLESLGDEVRCFRARAVRLAMYTRLGFMKQGLAEVSALEPLVKRLNDPRTSSVLSLNAALLYLHLDRFEESVRWCRTAIDLSLRQNDADNVFNTYGNLATALIALQRIDEALASYDLAISYAQRNDIPKRAAIFLYNRAYLFFMQGRYREALETLKDTRRDLEQEDYDLGCIDLTESEILLESNLFEKAISLAESARERFLRVEASHDVAQALTLIGFAHGQLGNYEQAGALLLEAKTMFDLRLNDTRAALVDIYRARLLLESGDTAAAKQIARSACDVFDREQQIAKAAFARLLIARCLLLEQDLPGAWKTAREASSILGGATLPWLSYQWHHLAGDLYRAEGNLGAAHECYQEAVQQADNLRSNLTHEEHRLGFAHDKEQLFENLIGVSLHLPGSDGLRKAFDALEKSKSRTLADLMTRSVSVVCANALLRDGGAQATDASFIRLYESSAMTGHVASLKDIQRGLAPDTALLEYFVLDGQIGAFVLRSGSAEVRRDLGAINAITRLADLLDFQFSRFRLGSEYVQSHYQNLSAIVLDHLRDLYAALLQPLEGLLAGCRRCNIVPHGPLHRVPFHALNDGTRYVIDKFAVSYAPSAAVYGICASRTGNAAGELQASPLLVGVEDSRIPYVADEIASLRELWPQSAILQNESATCLNFSSRVATANLVHVATHADFRHDNPMFSSIRLADRWMNVAEIYDLKMNADLVVLSGCRTGLGALQSGDEIIGLARGFLYAGARCLLVSLWDVHDRSASALMRHFYKNVAAGAGFADALQSAMILTREAEPHPYYWSSFRLVGYAGQPR
jgi:CHAT domain-containing protein/tetratricopeptide (TPR) repeat protein